MCGSGPLWEPSSPLAGAACQAVGDVLLRLNARCSLCQTFCVRADQAGSFITVWEPESWRRPQTRLTSWTATHATSSPHSTAAAHVQPSPTPGSNTVPHRLHSSQKTLCRAGSHPAPIRPHGHCADRVRCRKRWHPARWHQWLSLSQQSTSVSRDPDSSLPFHDGCQQSARQAEEATVEFRQARQRHPGIESAIHALQSGNGLARCRDYSSPGYARYVALGMMGQYLGTGQAPAGSRVSRVRCRPHAAGEQAA